MRSPQINTYQNTDDVLLSNLLAGVEAERTQRLLQTIRNIDNNSSFVIAVAQNTDIQIRKYILANLHAHWPSCALTEADDFIIALFWFRDSAEEIHSFLGQIASQTDTQWGISNTFSNLAQAKWYAEHAQFAQAAGSGPIVPFHTAALDYLLNQKPGESRYYARHPLVLYLENGPIEAKKELLDTLREYLLCERSIKYAAEKLFVHRNTVTYRIDQIRRLQMIDFYDEYDRQYALISLMYRV